MKLEDYFQLTLHQRIELEKKPSNPSNPSNNIKNNKIVSDSVSLLEKIRAYQINDIMSRRNISKYKLF